MELLIWRRLISKVSSKEYWRWKVRNNHEKNLGGTVEGMVEMVMNIQPMSREDAAAISGWKYEEPYSIYNMGGSQESIEELMDGTYYAVKDQNGQLMGFCCFGLAAQVPVGNSYGVYGDTEAVDIGIGMAPEYCGQGNGYGFLEKCIEFGRKELGIDKFRLTVADFNHRAIKVYERIGFAEQAHFERKSEKGSIIFVTMKL